MIENPIKVFIEDYGVTIMFLGFIIYFIYFFIIKAEKIEYTGYGL